jgi:hypothetical protein
MEGDHPMQDKIQTTIKNINQSPFMVKTTHLCRTFWSVVLVLGPAALSAYLLITTDDKVVTVLGVFSGVISLVNLVSTAYKANKPAGKKSRK